MAIDADENNPLIVKALLLKKIFVLRTKIISNLNIPMQQSRRRRILSLRFTLNLLVVECE